MLYKWMGTFFLYGVARDLRAETKTSTNIKILWSRRIASAMVNGIWYMNGVIPILRTIDRFQLQHLDEESRTYYSSSYEEFGGINKNILL